MMAKTLLLFLMLGAGSALAGERTVALDCATGAASERTEICVAPLRQFAPVPNAVILRPLAPRTENFAALPPVLLPGGDDVLAGAGPDAHAPALARIAVQASVGNIDGVEIGFSQLRQFGVTREELDEVIFGAQLHDRGASPAPVNETHLGWQASQ